MEEKLFYSAPGARTGDVIPKYIDGIYQIFYLKGWKNPEGPDVVHGWHRMESRDLIHMSEETPLYIQGGTGSDFQRWTVASFCLYFPGRKTVRNPLYQQGRQSGSLGLCKRGYLWP